MLLSDCCICSFFYKCDILSKEHSETCDPHVPEQEPSHVPSSLTPVSLNEGDFALQNTAGTTWGKLTGLAPWGHGWWAQVGAGVLLITPPRHRPERSFRPQKCLAPTSPVPESGHRAWRSSTILQVWGLPSWLPVPAPPWGQTPDILVLLTSTL